MVNFLLETSSFMEDSFDISMKAPSLLKNSRTMSNYLPREIWEKIFQRLTIKTLSICISVCKHWKSLITNQSFIQQFANNTNNYSLFLQFRCYGPKSVSQWDPRWCDKFLSIDSDNKLFDDDLHLSISKLTPSDQGYRKNFNVIGTCNGLVCLSNPHNHATVILMNPFIKKYAVLPKSAVGPLESSWRCTMAGFGFDSKNNDFKVVKVSLSRWEKSTPWVEVYSLDSGTWRSIIGRGPSLCLSELRITRDQMFLNGALHWLVFRKEYNSFILSFDLATEKFGEFLLPECLDFALDMELFLLKGGNSLALVYKDMLSYILDGSEIFEIWVMKEYGNVDSWNMIFSFDSRSYGGISRVIAMRNSGELVLERDLSYEIIFLDPKKDLVKCPGLRINNVGFAGDVEESLFLINEENNTSLTSNIIRKAEFNLGLS